MRSMPVRTCLNILFALAIALVAAPHASADTEPVDFLKQVYPIFQQHCLSCHGTAAAEGSLRLDQRKFAEIGGHTGSPILGGTSDTNAILLRVETDDPQIRMPKNSPPLAAEEIALLRRWVEMGTPWQDPPYLSRSRDDSGYAWTWERLKPWDPREWSNARIDRVVWWLWRLSAVWIPVLLWIGACDRARYWVKTGHPRVEPPRGAMWRRLAAVSRSTQLAALLLLAAISIGIFHQCEAIRADQQVAALRAEIDGLNRKLNPGVAQEGETPRPVRPRHPPRLGGEYYRGNDERNPKLFNGGFYRTCTMRVWLCREDGTILKWNDSVDPAACHIRFEIEKAPGAAEALFTPDILENSFVSPVVPGAVVKDPAVQVAGFVPTSEETWTARLPLDLAAAEAGRLEGTIYLYRGELPKAGGTPRDPHYAASYAIRLDDGRITPDSELWLGYVFRTGNVVSTPEGKIAEDEWFSFRPIPEIEGEQTTTDPKLLGIEEHEHGAPRAAPP